MNNSNIQKAFGLEQEFETWLVKFDPQTFIDKRPSEFWSYPLEVSRMPSNTEFEMRLRLDDRFNKNASLR
jgi:hypothetical protein